MSIRITSAGRSARDNTVTDINNAVEQLVQANAWLNTCKGMGVELYTGKLQDLIDRYRDLAKKFRNIG